MKWFFQPASRACLAAACMLGACLPARAQAPLVPTEESAMSEPDANALPAALIPATHILHTRRRVLVDGGKPPN